MIINSKSKNNRKLTYIIFLVFLMVALSFLIKPNTFNLKNDIEKTFIKNQKDINAPTILINNTIKEIVKNDIGLIKSDSICKIYITRFYGKPNLIYVYKEKDMKGRYLTDKIFSHIYLKDKTVLKKWKYINLSTNFKPVPFEFNNKKYVYTRLILSHSLLKIDNIDYINTGRYFPGLPRLYVAKNLKLNLKNFSKQNNSYETLIIEIKEKHFNKIKKKRNQAIKEKVLLTSDDDLIPVKVYNLKDQVFKKALVRLKGDWSDHLRDKKKWSFRVKLKGDETVNGMRKFSIQHPATRHYLWEWLFQKVIADHDIIALRYNFLNVFYKIKSKDSIRDINLGIMAIEESFDKILIEHNKKREGLILSFNESYLWKDRNKTFKLNLDTSDRERESGELLIRLFNENKVLENPKLLKQFKIAKGLIYELKKRKLKISEVFEIDKLTFFVALSNLFGGQHGLIWHNIRFYYNPIIKKFEPIAFDTYPGLKINKLIDYPLSKNDPEYQKALIKNLKLVSSQKFIQEFIDKYSDYIFDHESNLKSEFNFDFDLSILENNSNFIKKQLSPSTLIISSLKKLATKTITLNVKNLSKTFNVEIIGLKKVGGKILSKKKTPIIIKPNTVKEVKLSLKNSFLNTFVSKKNKKGHFSFPKDLQKVKLLYKIQFLDNENLSDIIPFTEYDSTISKYLLTKKENKIPDFAIINKKEKTILVKSGKYTLKNNFVIPANYQVTIEPGFNLDLLNNSSFISYSAINCLGTKKDKINFYSSDSTGKGVFISQTSSKSYLDYCNFTNLSNPSDNFWELSGAVNFYKSDVSISNSVFEKNRCEDALNIINANFTIDNSEFKQTFSDAFDGDFVKGTIKNTKFYDSGNDAIDISGSFININNISIFNPADKGISAGESSEIKGSIIEIKNGEIGIVSKDLSKVTLDKVKINNMKLGLSIFQKKSEYGPAEINITNIKFSENELNYLSENNSKLMLNNELIENSSDLIINKMYGNKYGKSSKR